MNGERTARSGATTRRTFLKQGAKASSVLAAGPLLDAVVAATPTSDAQTLLKNGLIVDGTGKKGYTGDVLLKGAKIEAVSPRPLDVKCSTIDCTGKVIAPGFIDVHSHMDWILAIPDQPELKLPFTAQGCTTFVAGNCGAAAAGYRKGSEHKRRAPDLFPKFEIAWDSMAGYFDHLRKIGMSHNMMTLVGHGTTRMSMREMDPSPLSDAEMTELLALLGEAMDQGACGVSLGLQYSPGIFATPDELEKIAKLVASKDKILTVHGRAYTAVAPGYELKPFGVPHNVLALKEMIDLARKTGVRVQYSHLIFAGTMSHRTYRIALKLLDEAIADGVDIMIDSYPYHCGNTNLSVILPKWFREGLPGNYDDPAALKKLENELTSMSSLLGFGYSEIQITHARDPELRQYNGMFLTDIAAKRGAEPFQTAVEFVKRGGAWVLLHKYSNMQIVEALMKHPACLFMTDAVPARWLGNPAAYGSFPLFLQYARDKGLISLQQAVHKMTGATAARFRFKDRGLLRKGFAADVTVFDYKGIKDNTTLTKFDRPPGGIDAVFVNGKRVKQGGKVDASADAGVVMPA